jgi:hypothetical protein
MIKTEQCLLNFWEPCAKGALTHAAARKQSLAVIVTPLVEPQ